MNIQDKLLTFAENMQYLIEEFEAARLEYEELEFSDPEGEDLGLTLRSNELRTQLHKLAKQAAYLMEKYDESRD